MKKKPIVTATDGTKYQIVGKGKVKKVASFDDLPDIIPGEAQAANALNATLYGYLKGKLPQDTVQKKGWIHCRGYKMRYTQSGFEMVDAKNFGAEVVIEEPTPRAIFERIVRMPSLLPPKEQAIAAAMKEAAKAKNPRPVRGNTDTRPAGDRQRKPEPKPQPEKPKTLEELREEALALIEATRRKEIKPAALFEKLHRFIPNRSLNVFLGKVIRRYQNHQVRLGPALEQMFELVKQAEFEKKKPAPKFMGVQMWPIDSLEQSEGQVVIRHEGSVTRVSPSEFLARFVLSLDPKIMPAVVKVARGEFTPQEGLERLHEKDKFTEFHYKDIQRPSETLARFCQEVLWQWETASPLQYVYRHYPKGTRLRVMWADYNAVWTGTVIETKGGVKLRYSDGSVEYLLKHQTTI